MGSREYGGEKGLRNVMIASIPDAGVYERLFSGARQLFARQGYSGTTVREIVAAAGVTKPVLYYYFRNKEGVYLELLREPFAKLTAFLDEFLNGGGSATKRLRQFCNRLHSLFCERRELLNLLQGSPPGTPFFDFEDYYRRLQNTIRRLIQEGIKRGEFQKGNVEEKVGVILGAVYMVSHVQKRDRNPGKQGKRLARTLNVIFKGIEGNLKGGKRRGI